MKRPALLAAPLTLIAAGLVAYLLLADVYTGPLSAYGASPGERVVDLELHDIDGERIRLSELFAADGVTAVVIAMRDIGCPVAQRYGHELARIEEEFAEPGSVLSFLPHMHTRGVAFRYDLIEPDGTERVLLDIPRYDFNWQLTYELEEPLRPAAGTRIRATGVYDDSEGNPFNPDPTVDVRFGEQTYEEMMIGYFDWVPDRARAGTTLATAGNGAPAGSGRR